MSDTKYVNIDETRNLSRKKYHTDTDCYALSDDYRELREHDERLNLLPCSYCASFRAEDIEGAWADD